MSALIDPSRLEHIAQTVVAEHAETVDRTASFPEASLAALADAGLYGLTSAASVGGLGGGPRDAVIAVERLAQECASTAMVFCMHLCGAQVIEKFGALPLRAEVAAGRHLSTLAFSEVGSRSHFWAPGSTATAAGENVRLDARKSWVTSAERATAYVWSSRPLHAEGASTLWLVPRDSAGLTINGRFDGLGLRGNGSVPVNADGVLVPASARLGPDGGGFDVMMGVVLPWFNLMNAASAIGTAQGAVAGAIRHASATRHENVGTALRDLPTIRASLARMRCRTDEARALLFDAVSAVETGRPDTMLRVLQAKAVAAEAAIEVTTLGMRVCGGAAYRREVGVERRFRDAQASSVMAPTTDVLYDFIGKAITGLELF